MSNGFAVQSYGATHAKHGSYAYYDQKLQGRNKDRRKLENNTYAERRGENIAIRLHATDIITIAPDGTITVNTGGYQTVTTKARLNEYLPSGFSIYQSQGLWSWRSGQPFSEGDQIVIENGEYVLKPKVTKTADELKKLRKSILNYAKGFAKALPVDQPGAGDCWICQFARQGGEQSTDHLESHIEEGYYVPTLLVSALEAFPIGDGLKACAFKHERVEDFRKAWGEIADEKVQSSVARYLYRQFNLPS